MVLLLAGIAGASLVRLAPGFGIDERLLDPRLSAESRALLLREHAGERNPFTFYRRFLSGLLHGDLGRSSASGEPVIELIRERAPVTARTVASGLALAWVTAFGLATATSLGRQAAISAFSIGLSGLLLSIPSAVAATLCLLLKLPPLIAIAAVAYPRLFPYIHEQFRASARMPHVLIARARGTPAWRLFFRHILPTALLPLLALTGVSVTLAFGASIPIEALADSPGLGQLAWNAALGRDLPVLVSVTLLLTGVTVVANAAADVVSKRFGVVE